MAPRRKLITSVVSFWIVCDLIKNENVKRRRKRRIWMSNFLKTRITSHLLADLRTDDTTGSFRNFSRMSPQDFAFLISIIGPTISKKDTNYRQCIAVEVRLAITLRFLATGDSYSSLMYLFRVSKQSIAAIIPEVCAAIVEALKEYIKMPENQQEWLHISEIFAEKWNFPHAIGAIDGKHVVIQSPTRSGSEYYNYKSFFSIVLFALVDANYNFLFVDVGCQGRISDGGVFKNTQLYKDLQKGNLNLPPPQPLPGQESLVPFVMLGDDAFALSANLMKPYAGINNKGSKERLFNYRLSRARRVVENAFGILSSVFRVLRKPILLQPERGKVVVMACVYLHNFLRKSKSSHHIYCPSGVSDDEVNGVVIPGTWRNDEQMSSLLNMKKIPRKSPTIAQTIRDNFSTYFSTNGIVPWQNQYA